MEYISLSFVKNNVIKQYGKQKHLKAKINDYFGSFVDRHPDINYIWLDGKAYVFETFGFQLKKEIEKLLNKQIRPIYTKSFPKDFTVTPRDNLFIKKKIEERIQKIKDQATARKKEILDKFNDTINNIKSEKDGFQFVGSFDLEFWEREMNRILEFGWTIMDYKGETKTTHIIVQENLKYENGQFSKNNRYARKDSKVVPLSVAMKMFQDDFLDKTDIVVGHGLTNDFIVLEANGLKLDIDYLDTSLIGAAQMNEDNSVSIERLLTHLKISSENLHNAANDAEYVLEAFKTMGNL